MHPRMIDQCLKYPYLKSDPSFLARCIFNAELWKYTEDISFSNSQILWIKLENWFGSMQWLIRGFQRYVKIRRHDRYDLYIIKLYY